MTDRNQNNYNRVNYYPDNDENRLYYNPINNNRNYGNNQYYNQHSDHGNYADGYGNEFNRNRPVNRYGGDTRNFGNANQGGFDRDWWDRTKDEVASWFGDDNADRRRKMDGRNMGGYRGKGPKNYHRSEARIREDVCDRLMDDDLVDATEIEVQVQGTEVILTGYVSSRDQKRRAEDIVESVSGVRDVENRLRVGHGQTEATTNGNLGATGSELT